MCIDELMNKAARDFIEQLLVLSAQEVAGGKHPGRADAPPQGMASREVAVPVYERRRPEPCLGQSGGATSW